MYSRLILFLIHIWLEIHNISPVLRYWLFKELRRSQLNDFSCDFQVFLPASLFSFSDSLSSLEVGTLSALSSSPFLNFLCFCFSLSFCFFLSRLARFLAVLSSASFWFLSSFSRNSLSSRSYKNRWIN